MNGFRDIERAIKSGNIEGTGVTLLCGEESFLVEHYERRLGEIFGEGGLAELNHTLFYGGETDDEAIIAALETLPLMAAYRVVAVRDHPGLTAGKLRVEGKGATKKADGKGASKQIGGKSAPKTKKAGTLADYIRQGLPGHARLILSCRAIDRSSPFYKALSGNSTAGMPAGAAVYDFGRLGDIDLKNFISKRFRREQVGISIRLMDEFIERTGYTEKDSEADLYKIDGDAVKTAVFVKSEGRNEVAPGDIETCIPPEIGTDVFKMLDALSAGKKAEAVTLLASALTLGENVFRLTNLLIGHFEILFACKEMKALGYPIQKMADILSQKSTFRIKKLAPYTDRFTPDRLTAILTRLYSVEKEIRVGNIKEELALITFFADA